MFIKKLRILYLNQNSKRGLILKLQKEELIKPKSIREDLTDSNTKDKLPVG